MDSETESTQEGKYGPEYQYTVVFEPSTRGGFIVTVPALSGLVTEGGTIEEAREMAKLAIYSYLESLIRHGEEIPLEAAPASVERIGVSI